MNKKELISDILKDFYNIYPFPGFDINKYNIKDDLLRHSTDYAKMIYANIPYGKKIIDIGCGTGQFTCLLSLRADYIIGIDFSKASIDKANQLKQRLELRNIDFCIVDLENLKIAQESFDYVFCNGVLHHLKDPYKGFLNICRFLKPDSYIIIGVYNKYGRMIFKIRRKILQIVFKNRMRTKTEKIKQMLINKNNNAEKEMIWYLDQYFHPYENSFTVSEIINWFNKNNISYINSMPSIESFNSTKLFTRPFAKTVKSGSTFHGLKHFFVQLSWIWSLCNSGGYFVSIGRR
jgi:ubiquinone/menaquinone biosynthesis C-methylase UbiE